MLEKQLDALCDTVKAFSKSFNRKNDNDNTATKEEKKEADVSKTKRQQQVECIDNNNEELEIMRSNVDYLLNITRIDNNDFEKAKDSILHCY